MGANLLLASLIFGVGVLSGLLGVGGGSLFIPIFVYMFKMNMHQAIGTSILLIIPTAIISASVHFANGNVSLKVVLTFFIFSIIGGFLGAHLSNYLPSNMLKKIFALFLLVVSVKMLMK